MTAQAPFPTKLTYRPDIDGLRALAVLAVVFYHAGFDVISGGYVGVDVFFVISGFLITSLIYKDLEAGKWVRTEGWQDAEAAKAEIAESVSRYRRT